MDVRVSVIIPLYNKAPYVRRALDSVAAQTFSDFEVVVVDDGSTDGGARLVESYGDARVRLIRQQNAGPGAARNRGVTEARGRLLAFLDADDEWLPRYIEEGVRAFDEYGPEVAAVTCGYYVHPPGASSEPMWRGRGIRDGVTRVTPSTSPADFVHMLAYMSPCTTMARADAVRRWGGFYARDRCLYAEDAHLWMKVLLNEAVAFSLEPRARLHSDASGLSNNLRGARPVEPFLRDPGEVEAACPEHMRPLLRRVLAARAFKTACVLGYWGDWRAARELARRHGDGVGGRWRLPFYLPSLVCRTPVGAGLGRAWRALSPR
jgi:glycosyltransferase involved in cell wall biosynthesis